MRAAIVVSLLAIGTPAWAQSPPDDAKATVKVYLLRNISVCGVNVSWAETITAHIFAEAGVHIEWRFGEPRRHEQDMPIIIDLSSNTPKTFSPDALAYARAYEGVHIAVFCDRIKNKVNDNNRLATFLLAHVMVHEIVHILERSDRHSKAGLMKARWTTREIEEISIHPLSLAPEDVKLVHQCLLHRATQQVPSCVKCG